LASHEAKLANRLPDGERGEVVSRRRYRIISPKRSTSQFKENARLAGRQGGDLVKRQWQALTYPANALF